MDHAAQKRCGTCGEVKDLSEFAQHPTASFGRSNKCRVCSSAYSKLWRERRSFSPESIGEKECRECLKLLPLDRFNSDRYRRDGRSNICRKCSAASRRELVSKKPELYAESALKGQLRTKYGITIADYDSMLNDANGKCECCGEPVERARTGAPVHKVAHVDHCHKSGVVCGILCKGCNTALGELNESPDRIRKLLRYAEKRKAQICIPIKAA